MIEGHGREELQRAQITAFLANLEALVEAMAKEKGIKLSRKASHEGYQLAPESRKLKKVKRQAWSGMSGVLGSLVG